MIIATEKPAIKISNNLLQTNSVGIAQRLNKYKIEFVQAVNNSSDIFYFESDDDQMRYFGIKKESLIVVDRSIKILNDMIIVCCVDGEWLTRKMVVKGDSTYLCINDSMDARLNITGKQIHIIGAVAWICQPLHQN